MIGQRLKLARVGAGLSLRALATKVDGRVTAQAISKYERNGSMPSPGVLMTLADALDVSAEYLVGDQEMVLEGVEFRKKQSVGKREEDWLGARVLYLVERYLVLEELLGLPTVAWDKPRAAPYPVGGDPAEVELGARSLRDYWGLGLDPILNLAELLEERGIKVLAMDLTNIDGLTARVRCSSGDVVPVTVVQRTGWGERQRFTMAHELGHLVLDFGPKVDDEDAAHHFAGAFLMPAEAIRTTIGKRRTSIGWSELFDVKRLFGVSVQALTYRCKHLGIFGHVMSQRLFDDFARFGWSRPPYGEPCTMGGEMPARFERLCFRALAEGAIADAEAAELLGIPTHDLNRRMEKPPEPAAWPRE